MRRSRLAITVLLLAAVSSAQTKPHKHGWSLVKHLGEHILLGTASYVAVSEVARAGGDRSPYWPGLLATGIVSALKEGTDAHNGTDTNWEAAWHAATIVGAAGAVAAIRH